MKAYIAAPPDTLRVDEKNLPEHPILNCCGVIIPTNHKTDGIYLPADDRRHYVAWSDLTTAEEDFAPDYWDLVGLVHHGGMCDVAAYLMQRDISSFDPKAPPPKTAAFWSITDANRAPEEAELADLLDKLGNGPDATTLLKIIAYTTGRLRQLDQGPQKPTGHSAPPRMLRIRSRPQRGGQRWPMGHRRKAPSHLRQKHPHNPRTHHRRRRPADLIPPISQVQKVSGLLSCSRFRPLSELTPLVAPPK